MESITAISSSSEAWATTQRVQLTEVCSTKRFILPSVIAPLSSQQQSAIASVHRPRCDRIQQLQQQIEAWQALLEKLGGINGE